MGVQGRRLVQGVRLPPTLHINNSEYKPDFLRKRVFLLGPSHHHYLTGAATTQFDSYATPLGDLPVDTTLVRNIAKEWHLEWMSADVDEAEHSLEMHLPYIYKMLSLYVSSLTLGRSAEP